MDKTFGDIDTVGRRCMDHLFSKYWLQCKQSV